MHLRTRPTKESVHLVGGGMINPPYNAVGADIGGSPYIGFNSNELGDGGYTQMRAMLDIYVLSGSGAVSMSIFSAVNIWFAGWVILGGANIVNAPGQYRRLSTWFVIPQNVLTADNFCSLGYATPFGPDTSAWQVGYLFISIQVR